MKGLSKDTEKLFQNIKGLDIFKDYMLIGGTALSLQIHHRLSEDLDFCKWQDDKRLKYLEIRWYEIEKRLKQFGTLKTDILDFYQVNFCLNDVKISFYSNSLVY